MTQTLPRPDVRVGTTPPISPRRLALSAVAASLWVGCIGLVCCVLVAVGAWFAADTGSFGGAVRVGALAWLVSLGAGLHVEGVTITAIPLGFTAVTAWLLYRGGRWVAASSAVRCWREAGWGSLAMCGAFVTEVAAVHTVTSADGVSTDLVRALVAACMLAGAFGGLGVVRGGGLMEQLLARLPPLARGALRGGSAGAAVLVMASGCLFTVALCMQFSAAVSVAEAMRGGPVGGAVVAAVGLAVVPNAVLCAGSYLVGPGFAIGTGTSVAPAGVTLGAVPAFPLFAALPAGDPHWWQQALVAIPVVAGGIAGRIAVRGQGVESVGRTALSGAAAGLVTGASFGVLTWLATGAIGPGRMQEVGPDWMMTTVIASLAAVLGGVAAPTAARWLAKRGQSSEREEPGLDPSPAEPSSSSR